MGRALELNMWIWCGIFCFSGVNGNWLVKVPQWVHYRKYCTRAQSRGLIYHISILQHLQVYQDLNTSHRQLGQLTLRTVKPVIFWASFKLTSVSRELRPVALLQAFNCPSLSFEVYSVHEHSFLTPQIPSLVYIPSHTHTHTYTHIYAIHMHTHTHIHSHIFTSH